MEDKERLALEREKKRQERATRKKKVALVGVARLDSKVVTPGAISAIKLGN